MRNLEKILNRKSAIPPTPLEFPIVGGGGMRGAPPLPPTIFFEKPPIKTDAPRGALLLT